jgi:hypothetical protein
MTLTKSTTITKTVVTTKTMTVDGGATANATLSSVSMDFEAKSIVVSTIQVLTTATSTLTNGVVVTSVTTVPITITSTNVLEVDETSTSTTHVQATIATTAAASHTKASMSQDLAQQYDINAGDRVHMAPCMAASLFVLAFAHYAFFARH